MPHKTWPTVVAILVLLVLIAAYGVTRIDISALPEPGRLETTLAMKAKDWYIGRASSGPMPAAPPRTAENIATGENLYGMACANCHGQNGRKPTPIGQSMYPRVPNLSSREVQEMPDRELFWVIKNGIRLSGMPGFAKINSDTEIWQMTYYVRSLGTPEKH